jgi:guanylate kinase
VSGLDNQRGALIVIAAPSGAGKTTLVHALLRRMPDIAFSVSHTTRIRRDNEVDGKDYFFVNDDKFRRMIDAGEFLEYALVFDHWYGTSEAEVRRRRDTGQTVLLEIDWQGAQQIRERVSDAKTIFIVPPSVEALETRLKSRATDSDEVIARRLRDSVSDLKHWDEFDYIIVNDDADRAADQLADIVAGGGSECSTDNPRMQAAVERILAGNA